ncbi:MAG: HNH endonuclease signature motif containing protein [Candidatus Methylomirabilales bacterium]
MRVTSRWWLVVFAAALFAVTTSAQPQAHYRTGAGGVLLPDPNATPGATFQVTAKQVCTKGYAQKVRNVPEAIKKQVYTLYGAKKKQGVCCEVDHLISLELGGSNDMTNLWPQPYQAKPGAYEKDILENFLHRAVCGGAMTLEEAQQKIATDWYKAYQEMKGNTP